MSKKCSACDFENEDKAKFCRGCGASLAAVAPQAANAVDEKKNCPTCQAVNKPNAKFCLGCGHKFATESEVATQQQSPLPPPTPTPVPPPLPRPAVTAPVSATLASTLSASLAPSPQNGSASEAASIRQKESPVAIARPPVALTPAARVPVRPPEPVPAAPKAPTPLPESLKKQVEIAAAEPEPTRGIATPVIIVAAGVVLVTLLAGGGYWYYGRPKAAPETPAVKTDTPVPPPVTEVAPIVPPAPPLETVKVPEAKEAGPSTSREGDVSPKVATEVSAATPATPTPVVQRAQTAAPSVPKAPVKPREARPKDANSVPKSQTPGSTTDSKKSAEDLRRQIEDELKGVVRKN